MGLFGRKVAQSTPNEGGVYWLAEGKYLVEVDTVKVHEGRKKRDFFIVSGKNIESDHEDRKNGSKCSWVSDLDNDATPGNVKMFLCGIYGIDMADLDEDKWEKLSERVIEDDNPLCGTLIKLNAVNIKTKAGNDFTKHIWSPAYDGIEEMPEKAIEIISEVME